MATSTELTPTQHFLQQKAHIQAIRAAVIRDILTHHPSNTEGLVEEQLMLAIDEAANLDKPAEGNAMTDTAEKRALDEQIKQREFQVKQLEREIQALKERRTPYEQAELAERLGLNVGDRLQVTEAFLSVLNVRGSGFSAMYKQAEYLTVAWLFHDGVMVCISGTTISTFADTRQALAMRDAYLQLNGGAS